MKYCSSLGNSYRSTRTTASLKGSWVNSKGSRWFTNDGRTEAVVSLARDECNQTVEGEWPTLLPTDTIWCPSIKAFSWFVGPMLTYVSQSVDGYLHLSFPHSPDEYWPSQPDSHGASDSTRAVKKTHPVYPLLWFRNLGWDKYWNRRIASSITYYHILSKDFTWRRKQNRLYLESRTPSWAGLWTLSYMPSIYGNEISTRKPGPLEGRGPGLSVA